MIAMSRKREHTHDTNGRKTHTSQQLTKHVILRKQTTHCTCGEPMGTVEWEEYKK